MPGNASLRIMRLRTLIDHPRTDTNERAAAQRMLDRLLNKAGEAHSGDRNRGERHSRVGRHAGLARIADMIGDDIALSRVVYAAPSSGNQIALADPIGDAPAEIRFVVATPHDAEISVTIQNVPRGWGWVDDAGIEKVSPRLHALAEAVAQIVNAYNHIDAHGVKRYFGRVGVPGETLVW